MVSAPSRAPNHASRSTQASDLSWGLRSDGTIAAWGDNAAGQLNVPTLAAGFSYVEAAAGHSHTVARRNDGSVIAWGSNTFGQCGVPPLPAGLGYTAIAAGMYFTVGLRSDGTVVVWGDNTWGQ